MVNLLGNVWEKGQPDWSMLLGNPRAKLHLYDKGQSRPGRKMGHFCIVGKTINDAIAEADNLYKTLSK